MPAPPPTTRFAPSPTGLLHLGSAYAAQFAHRRARDAGGRFLLRIEDIDRARCRSEYAAAIEQDLGWLGLAWDSPVRVQSDHLADYQAALDRLGTSGLLYPCFCSRADIAAAPTAPHGPDGPIYPGVCRHLPRADAQARIESGERYALRLDVAAASRRTGPLTWLEHGQGRLACDPAALGDPVLARKDTPASYHLCVTHDDAIQGVTLVTRGADLRPATGLHRLLQALMGWPEPSYEHHPLVLDGSGRRLAKRDPSVTIRGLREAGASPGDVARLLRAAFTGG